MRILWGVIACVACKQAEKQELPAPQPAPVKPDAAVVEARVSVDAAIAVDPPTPAGPPPGVLAARVDGVGPLNGSTSTDVKELKKLFPDHVVKPVKIKMGEGDLAEIYVGISKGKTLVLKVVGDGSVNHVDIMTNDVWNPWSATIGATYAETAKLLGPLDCANGGEATDWRADIAECSNAKLENYVLDFTSDEASSAEEMLAKPDLLAKAKLVAIRWEDPATKPPTGP